MRYHYLTDEEDRKFTELVLEYNTLIEEDEKKLVLENRITERTSILLYLIPIYCLNIKKEDAGGFFIEIQKDISEIIRGFRLTGLTYNKYLYQVCRYRTFRYIKRKKKEESSESAMFFADLTIYERPESEYCIPYDPENRGISRKVMEMDMKTLVNYIIEYQGTDFSLLSEKEKKLSLVLTKKIKRRQFVSFLLHLPQCETPGFIAGVSRIMRIRYEAASRLYTLRHEEIMEKTGSGTEEMKAVCERHWKLICRLRRAIRMESEEEKLKDLIRKHDRQMQIYHKRLNEVRKRQTGLTHTSISQILGVSRTAVTYDILEMNKLLLSIATS